MANCKKRVGKSMVEAALLALLFVVRDRVLVWQKGVIKW